MFQETQLKKRLEDLENELKLLHNHVSNKNRPALVKKLGRKIATVEGQSARGKAQAHKRLSVK